MKGLFRCGTKQGHCRWQGIFFIWTALLVASHALGCSQHRAPIQPAIDRLIAGIAAAVNGSSQLADMAVTIDGHRSEPSGLQEADRRITGAGKWLSRLPAGPVRGKSLVWVVLLLAAATLISEDITCIGAGLLVARGTIGIVPAVGASFSGIFLGDILLFLAGRFIGRPALTFPPFKWLVKESDIQRTSNWFSARGPVIIFTSRFMPGLRLPTYFAAGLLRTRFRQFALYFAVAVAMWTPLLVGLSAVVGTKMFAYYDSFGRYALLTLIGTVGLLWATARIIAPMFSHRGRRLLLSFFRRATRWEFWPPVVFYLPVVFYCIYLGLRFRSLTLFTACNPGIPEGGFREESKSQILNNLKGCAPFIARYQLISGCKTASEKIRSAKDFMKRFNLETPVVFKPDVGQRGEGVAIIRSEQQLERHLGDANTDQIIQEYVEGREFGIFYYRYPDADTGRIFSITDKRLLKVTGDGHSTLEQLILDDERAVCMAPLHLNKHQDQLFTVPKKGEEFDLVEVGTHCRGALFLDGNAIWTPEMEAAIDQLSKSFDGFYFGRYDIVTPSVDDLRKGRDFKIVELNGVTSEATHIYSPGTSLWRAYGVLMRQWRLAFEIGAINRRRGHKPAAAIKLVSQIFRLATGQQPPEVKAG
jgi:membrane protein DedA with SNARE-associated domain